MSLKSLVNKSIIKSDLRRYWYLGALFALGIFLFSVMFVIDMTDNGVSPESFLTNRFSDRMMGSLFPVCVFCVVIPALIFSYIHHKSAVSAMHSLPIKREGHFVSHLISIAVLIIAAVAVNMIILLSLRTARPWICNTSDIFIWGGITLVYAFVISGLTVFAAMITGSLISSFVMPYVFALLPLFVEAITYYLCHSYLLGFCYSDNLAVSRRIYLAYRGMVEDGGIILYIILGVIFHIAGLVCCKKRNLENHGSVVAFNPLNNVFLCGVAVCTGLCGYAYIGGVTELNSIWIAIPFGAAGIIIAKMIVLKSFRPTGFIKFIAGYAVFIAVLYVIFGMDITGFEKRMPDLNRIDSVNVVNLDVRSNRNYYNSDGDRIELTENSLWNTEITDKEDIELVRELHAQAAAEGKNDSSGGVREIYIPAKEIYIPLRYTLNDGTVVKRRYNCEYSEELYEKYAKVMDLQPVKADRFPILADTKKEYKSMTVTLYNRAIMTDAGEKLEAILKALKADVEKASFKDIDNKGSAFRIELGYALESVYEDGSEIADVNLWHTQNDTYNVHESYVNTISLLKEWGLYDKMDDSSDIKSVNISQYAADYRTPKARPGIAGDVIIAEGITDKAKIDKILKYMAENIDNNYYYTNEGERYIIELHHNNDDVYPVEITSKEAPPI